MTVALISVIVLLVSVLRMLQKERRRSGLFLCVPLLSAALLEFFDLVAVSGLAPEVDWKRFSLCVEAVLPAAWLLCSLTHARDNSRGGISRGNRALACVSLLLVLLPALCPAQAFFYAPDFPAERMLFLTDLGYYFYLAQLVLLVAALTNFEATLVSASPDIRWRVKLEIVALGSMLAVLVFYYSNALLYRTLNMELVPLRSLLFLVAALMVSYSRIHFRGGGKVRVSQRVLLKSLVLAAVAGYLVLLGVLGEGMKYFGPLFPRVLTLSLAFLAGMLLVLLLLSERLQRELKVFLHKNFSQSKYDYRGQWLSLTERLSAFDSAEDLQTRVLSAYCDIFGVRGGALFLPDDQGRWSCASAIRTMAEVSESIEEGNSLLDYLRERRWVFFSGDPNPQLLAENRVFLDRHRVSFVVPLFESERLAGFIALGERMVPGEQYRYEDYDLMKTIARQASVAIQHQRLSERLVQARAMEAVGNLATFVAHDLKNLAAAVSLVVENAKDHLDNPEFQQDMLFSLGNTARKMQGLIGRLRNLGEVELFQLRPTDLLALVERCAGLVQGAIAVRGSRELALADEDEMQKVILNLVLNGLEASEKGAAIEAEVGFDGAPYIRIIDRGCGMSARFVRNELFAPFRSTKRKGLGIGLYQCRQIVAAHGGRIEVASVEGEGTTFTVWFPSPAAEGAGDIIKAA